MKRTKVLIQPLNFSTACVGIYHHYSCHNQSKQLCRRFGEVRREHRLLSRLTSRSPARSCYWKTARISWECVKCGLPKQSSKTVIATHILDLKQVNRNRRSFVFIRFLVSFLSKHNINSSNTAVWLDC